MGGRPVEADRIVEIGQVARPWQAGARVGGAHERANVFARRAGDRWQGEQGGMV